MRDENAVSAAPQQRVIGRPFRPGESGNPHGRKPGSHAKYGQAYRDAMHEDFMEHGVAVIRKVRREKPEVWLRLQADLLPKDFNFTLTDERFVVRTPAVIENSTVWQAVVAEVMPPARGGDGV